MSFLYPGFLFALFAIAIPVVIHLFNFRRFKKIYFSNVKFLKEVEEQHSSKEKLKNLLILFARILTIIFLVLAFAQPFLSTSKSASATLGNSVSIYVDNSFSMQAANKDGILLDEAKRNAAAIVEGFGLNDRFQLLTNDFSGKDQRLVNREEFLKALDEVHISSSTKTLQPIINLQERILKGNANKFIYILSDFQTNITERKRLEVSPNINYNAIKIEPNSLPNVAADSVYFLSPNHQPGASEKLVVVLKNYSKEVANNIPIKLSINGAQKGAAALTINPGATARDTINFSGLAAGWQKGRLTIKDYPVNFDDSLFFSFNVNKNLPILAINGAGTGRYLSALYGADKYFELNQMSESNIDYGSFSQYKLIVLNGIKNPTSGLAQQVKSYVNAGGTLIILPYLSPNFSEYNAFLAHLSLPTILNLDTGQTRIDKIDFNHPIFKSVFESIPKNIDYPIVKRHFSFAQNSQNTGTAIMQISNGQTLFGSFRLGSGNIYLSATGFNGEDGNLATSPLFVPLMYRAALMGSAETPLFYTLGQEDAVLSGKVQPDKNQTLKLYGDKFEAIPELRSVDGRTTVYMADQIKKTGFYELKLADSLVSVFGFNNNRAESNMKYLTKAQIEALAPSGALHVFDAESDFTKFSSGGKEIAHTFWKLCIILSLVFMAAEILLVRFFDKISKQTI
ncbi:hypothetical protein ABIB40_000127 [Pedobacter sp. UYP30]|uniref:BatA domain-containing protein n=1 Tax=Pedobacter sp. UYP30 TaxID=1756400 RepID=UPI0033959331